MNFKIQFPLLLCIKILFAVKIIRIEEDVTYETSIIKKIGKILITACYVECTQNSLCKKVGYQNYNDNPNFVDCYLLGKEPKQADKKSIALFKLMEHVSILLTEYEAFLASPIKLFY